MCSGVKPEFDINLVDCNIVCDGDIEEEGIACGSSGRREIDTE
jgi:hypothetical protein